MLTWNNIRHGYQLPSLDYTYASSHRLINHDIWLKQINQYKLCNMSCYKPAFTHYWFNHFEECYIGNCHSINDIFLAKSLHHLTFIFDAITPVDVNQLLLQLHNNIQNKDNFILCNLYLVTWKHDKCPLSLCRYMWSLRKAQMSSTSKEHYANTILIIWCD